MRKSLSFAFTLLIFCCALSATGSAQVINELGINPGGTDNPCEFIELRGTPGSIIQNVYFVAIEGDAAPSGTADTVIVFAAPGIAFGSNGLIVVTGTAACGSRTYPPDTTRVQFAFLDTTTTGLENGTISFLLISSPTPIVQGTDLDTDNNGTLEGLPAGAIILDAVAWFEGDNPIDLTYGGVVLTTFNGTIGAATRSPNNLTPLSSAAWYAGALTGTNDATTYSATVRTPGFPANGVLTPGAPNVGIPLDAPVDFSGDGRTDWVVVRAAGGAGSQLTWYRAVNGGNPDAPRDWGVSGDQILMGDYDGDGKDDETVFRPSNGTFYIIQSGTLTLRIEQFGQNGDNARIVGDYNGDLRDDLAVYRPGPQGTWFYKTSPTANFNSVVWGEAGDRPAPGDYDGDGKADFVVQRSGGGSGVFLLRYSNNTFTSFFFGPANAVLAPGDYDGDGRTDVAFIRESAGFYEWVFEPSGTAGITERSTVWGVTGDVVAQGDYNGDGRTDYAVWRPGNPATFYVKTAGGGNIFTYQWGQTNDLPAAGYNTF